MDCVQRCTDTIHGKHCSCRLAGPADQRRCVCCRAGTDCNHEHTVTPCSAGHQLLLPLTQSLYVNGTIAQPDKVMIDIGTGYFVEVRKRRGGGRRGWDWSTHS